MIRVTRRRVLLAVLALFLFGVGYVAWSLAGLPPVKYYLRYGLDPYCEATGEKQAIEGIEFVEIGPGVFRMGDDRLIDKGDRLGRLCHTLGLPWGKQPIPCKDTPHWVEFRRGFWIATTEITNLQFEQFQPGRARLVERLDDGPAVGVTWPEAKRFCDWLAQATGVPIRLPSEAEWECACRAGSNGAYCFGDDVEKLGDLATYQLNETPGGYRVAQKKPNRWGLYDMHGGALEWCEDLAHLDYEGAPTDGSAWTSGGIDWGYTPARTCRGGGFGFEAARCRSATRHLRREDHRGPFNGLVGFRPAFTSPDD